MSLHIYGGDDVAERGLSEPNPGVTAGIVDIVGVRVTFQLAQQIATQLGETQYVPFAQIGRVIERVGQEVTQALADEAVALSAAGEMLTPDGIPRTVGGIFFFLVRQRIDPAVAKEIFLKPALLRRIQQEELRLNPDAPQPPKPSHKPVPTVSPGSTLPPFQWADKAAIYTALRTEKGRVQTVKITLIGRPGRVVEKQDLVITMMTQMQAPASFPKGVPQPPTTPTDYTIYIAAKQWNKVAEAMKNPEDKLIIEGFAAFDPALEGMAVFVTNATTKLLQQQKR